MEYFGVILILLAAGLHLVSLHSDAFRSNQAPRKTATMRAMHTVPPGAAAIMMAVAGLFIFVTSINSR